MIHVVAAGHEVLALDDAMLACLQDRFAEPLRQRTGLRLDPYGRATAGGAALPFIAGLARALATELDSERRPLRGDLGVQIHPVRKVLTATVATADAARWLRQLADLADAAAATRAGLLTFNGD